MIKGIHHVSALTKSFNENHRFYSEILGLRLVKNTVNQDNIHMRHLFYGDYISSPGTLLTFLKYRESAQATMNAPFLAISP